LGADARNTAVPGSLAWHRLTAVSIRSSSGWRNLARARSTSLTPADAQVSRLVAAQADSGPPGVSALRRHPGHVPSIRMEITQPRSPNEFHAVKRLGGDRSGLHSAHLSQLAYNFQGRPQGSDRVAIPSPRQPALSP
jgi:hypothetical protein